MATRPIEKEIDVDAHRERVWDVLTGSDTYRQWTAEFAEGSYAETDWQEGSSVRFFGPAGTGLVGSDDTESEQARVWAGTHETYRRAEAGGGTHLAISAPMADAYHDDMLGAWDRALAKVKGLAEAR